MAFLFILFYYKIPIDIIYLPVDLFKLTVKNLLIRKSYYTINDYINDKQS